MILPLRRRNEPQHGETPSIIKRIISRKDSFRLAEVHCTLQVFFAHSDKDNDQVKAVAVLLRRRDPTLGIWLDEWELKPGDSLTEKIGKGIESSDKLVAFLSPNSIDSNWVKKEVATGIILELAEEKGIDGQNFLIPVILQPVSRVPVLLRDKIWVDFAKYGTLEEACERLYQGISGKGTMPDSGTVQNIQSQGFLYSPSNAKYGIEIRFTPRVFRLPEVNFRVELPVPYKSKSYGFAKRSLGGHMAEVEDDKPNVYGIRMQIPVELGDYFWFKFESDQLIDPKAVRISQLQ
jgi:hypothetical protein